jgi:hypothetical protein
MPPQQNASARANAALKLPDGFKTYSPYPFGGMNTEASAVAIDDKEFIWRENFIKLGDGNLRTVWDVGTPLYTAPDGHKIVWFGFYSINAAYYCAVFLDDGSAIQVNTQTLAQVLIGSAGTFYSNTTKFKPFLRQWGNQWIVICNHNTVNDYWVWDGTLLYTAGTAAPDGVNIISSGFSYSSTPTVTPFGGFGGGMTFAVTENAGEIVAVNITNPGSGYQVGDVVQLAFSDGGADTGPELVANLNAGGVGGVNITNPGSGYTTASIAFSGGGGGGAAGTVLINTGVVSVPVTNSGSGYTFATVGFSGGGGSGAMATANIVGGTIVSVTVVTAGSGYTSPPTATITGNGTSATCGTVVIGGGAVSGVQITNPGSGYTTAPGVLITGNGSNATGVALLAPEGVQSVTVVNGGSGFTSVPLIKFVGGEGAGAVGVATLTATSIARVELTAGGSNFNTIPTVTFVGGGGSGASAYCVMEGGSVAEVVMTSGGSGYTGAVEVFIDLSAAQYEFNATLIGQMTYQPAALNQLPFFTGSGAGGRVVFTPTSISGVIVSAAGQFYTTAPAVEVQPGANGSAYATVNLMPYGISGTALESFLSRIWIVAPDAELWATIPGATQFSVSAPNAIWDFATSDGGETQSNVDAYLQTAYTGVRQSSGYLYFFGDESVSVVSNVATAGTPVVTSFNYQNVDPQTGLSWRDTLQDYGRATILANTIGVFGLYGGAATKISAKMDGVFRGAQFPPVVGTVTPSGAVATIFDIKHYLCLMSVLDPDTLALRTAMLAWNEKDWCILSQSPNLTYIGTQAVGTTFNAFGTDGSNIYPLFNTPSTAITKRLETKYYGADRPFIVKSLQGVWITASDLSTGAVGITGSLSAVISGTPNYDVATGATVINQIYSSWNSQPTFASPTPYFATWGSAPQGAVAFTTCGMRFSSTSPDFKVGNWVLGYREEMAIF